MDLRISEAKAGAYPKLGPWAVASSSAGVLLKPAEKIVAASEKAGADFIVVGTRGLSEFGGISDVKCVS